MTAANHFDEPMDPDLMEFLSIKYCYHPLLFVKLRSGKIAVASGLGNRTLREMIDPSTDEGARRLVTLMLDASETRSRSPAEERVSLERQLDLSDFTIDIFDLGSIKL